MTSTQELQAAEIAELKAKIEQRDAEIERIKAEIEQRDAKIEKQSLMMLIKQPISFVDRTASQPHIARDTHKPVYTVETIVELQNISLPEEVLLNGRYLRPEDKEVSIHSEAMVVAEAVKIIEAVIEGLELCKSVRVATKTIIAGVECDIVLLYGSQRIPFAVIGVKKPGYLEHFAKIIFSSKGAEGVEDAGIVAGQNSDQLGALECMGCRSLFGMITNGNNWMITCRGRREFALPEQDCWTQLRSDPMETGNSPERDARNVEHFEKTFRQMEKESKQKKKASRKRKSKHKKKASRKRKRKSKPENEKEEGNGEEVKEAGSLKEPEPDDDTGDRTLTVSQLISSTNSEDLIKLIIAFIRLAGLPLLEKKSKPILSRMSCRVLTLEINADPQKQIGGDMRCSFEKHSFSRGIDLSTYLNFDKSVKIYLCYHLGSGWCGDCCLAATEDGRQCCAVKFFIKPRDTDLTGHEHAEEELKNWGKVYKTVKCHVGKLPNGDGYLCMPYHRPVPRSDRQILLDNNAVEKALQQFASSGYIHDDVLWRHLGFWNGELCFCDLGSISKVTEEGATSWIGGALSNLRDRVKRQSSTSVAGSTLMHGDDGFNLQNNAVHSETANLDDRKHSFPLHASMDMPDGSNKTKQPRLK